MYKQDTRETQLVVIGKSKGVGAAMGYQLINFLFGCSKGEIIGCGQRDLCGVGNNRLKNHNAMRFQYFKASKFVRGALQIINVECIVCLSFKESEIIWSISYLICPTNRCL